MKIFHSLAVGAFFLLGAGAPAKTDPLNLTPIQILQASVSAMDENRPRVALTLINALLERNPNDVNARLVHARVTRQLGKFETSRKSARQAWKFSKNPQAKYSSALLMAQALSSSNKRTLSQLWLRRAVQHAPNERARRIAMRDFGYVRARNPWSTHLRFSVAPNSNINNGSANATSFETLGGLYPTPVELILGGSALALSGIEQSLGFTTRYRFAQTQTRASDFAFQFDHKTYVLSGDARTISPATKGRDFAFTNLSFSYTQLWKKLETGRETTLVAAVGTNWYGGEAYGKFVRLTFGQTFRLSRSAKLNWSLSTERAKGERAPHADVIRANIGLTKRIKNGATLRYTLRATDSRSLIDSADYKEVAAGVSYFPRAKFFGIAPSFGLTLRKRDYPVSGVPEGRHDREISTYMRLRFTEIDYYGFNPSVTLTAAKTLSNIGRFDTKRFGLQIGVQSAF